MMRAVQRIPMPFPVYGVRQFRILSRAPRKRPTWFESAAPQPGQYRGLDEDEAFRSSESPRSLAKVPAEPSSVIRLKCIPSTTTLNHLVDILRSYGRLLRVEAPNPINPARDLVFAEYQGVNDAIRAKESIEKNIEKLFDWRAADQRATKTVDRLRPSGRMPPKPDRRMQIAFAANHPVRHPAENADILLQLRGLPSGAESAIEIAMRLAQYRVSTSSDGSYYIRCDDVMRAIAIRDEFWGTVHRLSSVERRLGLRPSLSMQHSIEKDEGGQMITLEPILVIVTEKHGARYFNAKPKPGLWKALPRIGLDSAGDVHQDRRKAEKRMDWLISHRPRFKSDSERRSRRPGSESR